MNFSPDNKENLPRNEEAPEFTFEVGVDGYFGLGNEASQIGISGKIDKNIAMVTHIIVSQEHRGKDYGRRLIQELEKNLASRGIEMVYTFFRSEDTTKFLASQGYLHFKSGDLSEEDREVLQSKLGGIPPYLILFKKL